MCKENYKNKSSCYQSEYIFDYHGIKKALCGKIQFTPKRILVIQMKMTEEQIEIERKRSQDQKKQLEEWTGLKYGNDIFDSDIDNWSKGTSVLNDRIIGKKQLIFLIEDEDGERFGYYLNTEVIERYWQKHGYKPITTDNKSFHFNLQSNGRLKQPMKFESKNVTYGGYILFEKSNDYLIYLGDIELFKENYKNQSFCGQSESHFDYHGIKNALCGKIQFTSKRILVIQMK